MFIFIVHFQERRKEKFEKSTKSWKLNNYGKINKLSGGMGWGVRIVIPMPVVLNFVERSQAKKVCQICLTAYVCSTWCVTVCIYISIDLFRILPKWSLDGACLRFSHALFTYALLIRDVYSL
jgi:hypothetical protein